MTVEDEDFQKMLRASLTMSSVSSQQQPKNTGKAGKERTQLSSFINDSKPNKKPVLSSKRHVLDERKSSNDFNHIKLIPKLFNESDTMNSKEDGQRSKEFRPTTDREMVPKHATLADMILPKSKLNPSKEQSKH